MLNPKLSHNPCLTLPMDSSFGGASCCHYYSLMQWPFKFLTRIVKPSDKLENLIFCVTTFLTKRTSVTNMALVINMTSVKNMTSSDATAVNFSFVLPLPSVCQQLLPLPLPCFLPSFQQKHKIWLWKDDVLGQALSCSNAMPQKVFKASTICPL